MKNVTTKKMLIVSVILAVIITGCSVNKPDQQAAKDSNVELNNALINEEITKIITSFVKFDLNLFLPLNITKLLDLLISRNTPIHTPILAM